MIFAFFGKSLNANYYLKHICPNMGLWGFCSIPHDTHVKCEKSLINTFGVVKGTQKGKKTLIGLSMHFTP